MTRIYLDINTKQTVACSNGGAVRLCHGCKEMDCIFLDITPDKVVELKCVKGGQNGTHCMQALP